MLKGFTFKVLKYLYYTKRERHFKRTGFNMKLGTILTITNNMKTPVPSKYNTLIGKRITVEFNGEVQNAYYIQDIAGVGRHVHGRGEMYQCEVKWENDEKQGSYPQLMLDKTTLDELCEKNISVSPLLCNLYYIVENAESILTENLNTVSSSTENSTPQC